MARTYDVSKTVVGNIIHDAVYIFRKHMVPESINPTGGELVQVMTDFEGLCKLPGCCGAIDGTFIRIIKPSGPWGDVYYCCKKYTAIMIFACVDARGIFMYMKAGDPGSNSYRYRFRQHRLQMR